VKTRVDPSAAVRLVTNPNNMKPTATPGPWVQYHSNRKLVLKLRPDGHFNLLAECQNEGDARLIAAAPNLLAALKKVTLYGHRLTGPKRVNFTLAMDQARAAIARACDE